MGLTVLIESSDERGHGGKCVQPYLMRGGFANEVIKFLNNAVHRIIPTPPPPPVGFHVALRCSLVSSQHTQKWSVSNFLCDDDVPCFFVCRLHFYPSCHATTIYNRRRCRLSMIIFGGENPLLLSRVNSVSVLNTDGIQTVLFQSIHLWSRPTVLSADNHSTHNNNSVTTRYNQRITVATSFPVIILLDTNSCRVASIQTNAKKHLISRRFYRINTIHSISCNQAVITNKHTH